MARRLLEMTVPSTVLKLATRPLGSGESPDLGLLVHTVDNSRHGRVQMQDDDVVDLLHKLRIGGELEPVLPAWLQLECLPDPSDR